MEKCEYYGKPVKEIIEKEGKFWTLDNCTKCKEELECTAIGESE